MYRAPGYPGQRGVCAICGGIDHRGRGRKGSDHSKKSRVKEKILGNIKKGIQNRRKTGSGCSFSVQKRGCNRFHESVLKKRSTCVYNRPMNRREGHERYNE